MKFPKLNQEALEKRVPLRFQAGELEAVYLFPDTMVVCPWCGKVSKNSKIRIRKFEFNMKIRKFEL